MVAKRYETTKLVTLKLSQGCENTKLVVGEVL